MGETIKAYRLPLYMKQVDLATWVPKQEIVAHVSFTPQVAYMCEDMLAMQTENKGCFHDTSLPILLVK